MRSAEYLSDNFSEKTEAINRKRTGHQNTRSLSGDEFHLMDKKHYSKVIATMLFFSITPTVQHSFTKRFLVVSNAAPTQWKSDILADQKSSAIIVNGIIFNHDRNILLTRKFKNVHFLFPFPIFDINVSTYLGAYIEKLEKLWSRPNWECHLDYYFHFQNYDSTFDIDWLLQQFHNGVHLAEQ